MFNYFNNLDNLPLLIIITVWSLIWKGLALWRAARLNQKPWYVIMLIVNTVGILEIIYLLVTQKKVKPAAANPDHGQEHNPSDHSDAPSQ